jgi:hypothetical protein
MKKVHGHTSEVRRICRAINDRGQADDRQKLQTLVVQLQAVLREGQRSEPRSTALAVKSSGQREDPFDKVLYT